MRSLQFKIRAIERRGLIKTRASNVRRSKRSVAGLQTTVTARHINNTFKANQMVRLPELHAFQDTRSQVFKDIQQRMSAQLMLFKFNRLTLN